MPFSRLLTSVLAVALLSGRALGQFDTATIDSGGPPLQPRIATNLPSQTVKYGDVAVETSTTATAAETVPDAPALTPPNDCDALWVLNDIELNGYNPAGRSFSAHISCGTLNQTGVRVYKDGAVYPSAHYTVSNTGIVFTRGLEPGHTTIVLAALDMNGHPYITSFDLLFGSIVLPILLKYKDGKPISNVLVEANAPGFHGFTQRLTTDSSGRGAFHNYPPVTIALTAHTSDNRIAVARIYAGDGPVTMELIPFNVTAENAKYDFSNDLEARTGSECLFARDQKASDPGCEECGNCDKCESDPMCSDTCLTEQPGTCTFYRDCMEASKPCADDPDSYALSYGEKNCLAYQNNLDNFSPQGQSFVLGTMMCLQDALRPVVNCGSQCSSLRETAFNSHPVCYVQNGFCGLTCGDYWQVFRTVGGELWNMEAIKQVVQTTAGCLEDIEQRFSPGACGDDILDAVDRAIVYAAITGSQLVDRLE